MLVDKASPGRLALAFRGARTRWALPVSSILEVGPAPEGDTARRRGLPVEDFGALLGVPTPVSATTVTLVLDCSPPRALAIEAVEEVADLAAAPFFQLPEALGPPGLVRGAVLHRERLFLELEPQALAEHPLGMLAVRPSPALPVATISPAPPGRALVYEVGELGLLASPLALVTGVLRASTSCFVPGAACGHIGLIHHERSILSLFDLALVAGRPAVAGELAVALDVAGHALGVVTNRVEGVLDGFGGEPRAEPGGVRWRDRRGRGVLFPDLEHWVFP